MTTHDKAKKVIQEMLLDWAAKGCDRAEFVVAEDIIQVLLKNRIALSTMTASPDLFKRFHAHARFLGRNNPDGFTYEDYYTMAIDHAIVMEDWPMKVITRKVEIDGREITVDVPVPESTKKANNRQLMLAYEVIKDEARRLGLTLPEDENE